ncbi:MAG: ester cyclase [Baekduia sp.]
MSAKPDDLVERFQQALTGRDRRPFEEICAVDVHYEDPFSDLPVRGIGPLADHVSQLWVAAPDAKVEPAGPRLTGGRIVSAPLRITGTHTGTAGHLPATGRTFDTHMVLYCELDPGRTRLWRIRAFLDAYALAVQLGILPARGGAADRALMVLRGFGLRLPGR